MKQIKLATCQLYSTCWTFLILGHKSRGKQEEQVPREFRVGDANANCALRFWKILLRIHQKPLQAKNSIFLGGGGRPYSSPPTKPSGSASVSTRIPPKFTPVFSSYRIKQYLCLSTPFLTSTTESLSLDFILPSSTDFWHYGRHYYLYADDGDDMLALAGV